MTLEPTEQFKDIYAKYPAIAKERGRISEADTRANILDRILHEVLIWPRTSVQREPFINDGYIDYLIRHGRPVFLLEAKAQGETFFLPYCKSQRRKLKIKSLYSSDKTIKDAIMQAQRYCVDTGTRYAVVSNGYSFIIFRAIVEGYSWLEGTSVVFYDFNDIKNNFSEFWDLLSYEAVVDGKLEDAFRHFTASTREHHKPIDTRADADASYGRNPYASALRPFIERFFGDIAAQDTIELLKNCYVYSIPIQYIDADLNLIIRDQIPNFAKGATHIGTNSENEGGSLGSFLQVTTHQQKGQVAVLMGGIGSGKTTYCRRFFRVVAPELIGEEGPATLFHLNFLGAPDDEKEIINYTWQILSKCIKELHPHITELPSLKKIFCEELALVQNIFKNSDELDRKIVEKIYSSVQNDELFSDKTLAFFLSNKKMPILVFDNIDQLKISVQAQVFTMCQRIVHKRSCISILAVREESFSTALMQKHITAYSVHPYHLSSPRFKNLLGLRIDFAAQEAASISEGEALSNEHKTYSQILNLFRLLRESIFGRNYNILRLVESIAYGNMRLALRLFSSFVTSGATDIAKIVTYYAQGRGYTVPFHEFTKSIMLGEHRFYKESRSPIVNIFNATRQNNASHFTALRILKYVYAYADTSDANSGFISLHALISDIVDIFKNEEDCKETIQKLIKLERQLIELDSRRTDSIEGASEIRITTSGIYYLDYLVKSFAYLDLVWHDTPFSERAIADSLASKILLTDMNERFSRVDSFIEYLAKQEENELKEHNLKGDPNAFWGPFMPSIASQLLKEKQFIRKKLHLGET